MSQYTQITRDNFNEVFSNVTGLTQFVNPYDVEDLEERKRLQKVAMWYLTKVQGDKYDFKWDEKCFTEKVEFDGVIGDIDGIPI